MIFLHSMSAKGYIISLSLAGTVAALSLLMFQGKEEPAWQPVANVGGASRPVPVKRAAAPSVAKAIPSAKPVAAGPVSPSAPKPAAAERALTPEELTARVARVEQEANHDLRRLVELLDLNETQQDRVFQALVEHSPSWTPGMQVAPSAGAASSAGKRSELAAPGLYVAPVAETPVAKTPVSDTPLPGTPADSVSPVVDAPAVDTDPMDEIMALLDPIQQDTLLKDEMDRAAWWAEVLEQITPPDDVPPLTPAVPGTGAGDVQTYEGSDVLE